MIVSQTKNKFYNFADKFRIEKLPIIKFTSVNKYQVLKRLGRSDNNKL